MSTFVIVYALLLRLLFVTAFDDGPFFAVAQVAAGVEQVSSEFDAIAMFPVSLTEKRGAKARSAPRAEPASARNAPAQTSAATNRRLEDSPIPIAYLDAAYGSL